MNNLDDLLARVESLRYFNTNGLFANARDNAAHNGNVDIGL